LSNTRKIAVFDIGDFYIGARDMTAIACVDAALARGEPRQPTSYVSSTDARALSSTSTFHRPPSCGNVRTSSPMS
jgi:hypothetical protein